MYKKINIGQLIKQELVRQERSGAWLARKLYTDPSNVSKILKRQHIDTELLLNISVILGVDFFAFYTKDFKERETHLINSVTFCHDCRSLL